ncbi:hypothetical protein HWV62_12068 [Athelia sp. TMB]|nr:hypothetical protein HWV62_12068 [Athelia sp. TMB]
MLFGPVQAGFAAAVIAVLFAKSSVADLVPRGPTVCLHCPALPGVTLTEDDEPAGYITCLYSDDFSQCRRRGLRALLPRRAVLEQRRLRHVSRQHVLRRRRDAVHGLSGGADVFPRLG